MLMFTCHKPFVETMVFVGQKQRWHCCSAAKPLREEVREDAQVNKSCDFEMEECHLFPLDIP